MTIIYPSAWNYMKVYWSIDTDVYCTKKLFEDYPQVLKYACKTAIYIFNFVCFLFNYSKNIMLMSNEFKTNVID